MITSEVADKIKPGMLVNMIASDEWSCLKSKCGIICDTAQLFSHKSVTVKIDDINGEPIVVRRLLNEIALCEEIPQTEGLPIDNGTRIIPMSESRMVSIGKYLCVDYMLYDKTCCVFSRKRKSKDKIVMTFTPDKKPNGKNVVFCRERIPLYFGDIIRKFGIPNNVRKFRIVSAVSVGSAVKITLQPIVDQGIDR